MVGHVLQNFDKQTIKNIFREMTNSLVVFLETKDGKF